MLLPCRILAETLLVPCQTLPNPCQTLLLAVKEWLPDSGYEEAGKFVFEYYDDERFKGMENLEESELDVWVPIKGAGQ